MQNYRNSRSKEMNGGKSPQRKSTRSITSNRAPSQLSSLRNRPSTTPSGSLISRPSIEVQVPWVPPYIPNVTTPALPYSHFTVPSQIQDGGDGTIISRYTKVDGTIGFTVRVTHGLANETNGDEGVEVDLAQIYEHVTPEELERYENHDWELEDERERNRPKLGRPRKRPPLDGPGLLAVHTTPQLKRPRGRPPKSSVKKSVQAGNDTPSAFVAVHVPSPVKPGEAMAASLSSAPSRSAPNVQHERELTTSSVEDISFSLDRNMNTQVDQLTPSIRNKVTGAKSQGPSPNKRHKASYSMVQAALGDSETSDEDELAPYSDSEDELTLAPTNQKRRLIKGAAEVANPVPDKDDGDEELFLTPIRRQDSPTQQSPDDRAASAKDQSPVQRTISSSSTDVTDLLEQFQARKTRGVQSKSPTRLSPNAIRSNTMVRNLGCQNPAKNSSMTAKPQQHPPAPSVNQTPQLGFLHGLKKAVLNTFSPQKAMEPSPVPPKTQQHQFTGPILGTRVDHALSARRVEHQQPTRKRQGQLPWGSASSNPIPNATPLSKNESTPPSSRKTCHSMTPHFPRSKRFHQNITSPSLRGGIIGPAASNRSSKQDHHAHLTSSHSNKTIIHKGHTLQPLSNNRHHSPVLAGPITLGDLETSSEDNDPSPPPTAMGNRHSSPRRRLNQAITLGDLETSSEYNDHSPPPTAIGNHHSSPRRRANQAITLGDLETSSEEDDPLPSTNNIKDRHSPGTGRGMYGRSNQAIKLGSPITSSASSSDSSGMLDSNPVGQFRHDRPSDADFTKKRRRASDESGKAGEGTWYRMVRR